MFEPTGAKELNRLTLGVSGLCKRLDDAAIQGKRKLYEDIEDELRRGVHKQFMEALEAAFSIESWNFENDGTPQGCYICTVGTTSHVYSDKYDGAGVRIKFLVKVFGHGKVKDWDEIDDELCHPDENWFKRFIEEVFDEERLGTSWVPSGYDHRLDSYRDWFTEFHIEAPDAPWEPPEWLQFQFELDIEQ